ncbi:MAG: hypothetical protein NT004_13440 [Bacteroidetes bacterium]|nr:hypothetical protein [Bacteroidota bacterium]
MKNVMIVMLVTMVAVLSSCNKNDQVVPSSQVTDATSLPAKAVSYAADNYPDATIDYVLLQTNAVARYIAVLNTTEELAFTTTGDYLGDGKQYRGGHHQGDTIHCDTIHGGEHHVGGHHGGHNGNQIPVDSLPVIITDFISANYAGYSVIHAEYDTLCPEGAVKEVMISISGAEPMKLVFDSNDTFLMQANRALYSTIPQAVKDYITANYSGYQVSDKSEKLTLADNSIQHSVYIRFDSNRKKVRITDAGILVCVQ